jgi:hypothetical protein
MADVRYLERDIAGVIVWQECPFLVEAVEKIPRIRIFETMIQRPGKN